MATFGEALRKERESRSITLETVVSTTKISTRHLQALESDRFDQLPGGVFNKSMVRNYARTLGLEEGEWLQKYLDATAQNDIFNEDEKTWTAFAENVGRSRGKDLDRPDNILRWAGVAALLLVLSGLSLYVWGYVHHKSQAAAPLTLKQALAMRD